MWPQDVSAQSERTSGNETPARAVDWSRCEAPHTAETPVPARRTKTRSLHHERTCLETQDVADGNGHEFAQVAAQFEGKWPSQKPTLARQSSGCMAMHPVWNLPQVDARIFLEKTRHRYRQQRVFCLIQNPAIDFGQWD